MRRVFLAAIIAAYFSAATLAAEPKALIMGPDEVRAGDLVVLRTEGSAGADYAWTVLPPAQWEGRYFVSDGGRTLVFAARQEGTAYFVLAIAGGDRVATATHSLTNGTSQPEPRPDPTPPTPSDLSAWVTTTYSASVSAPNRQALAQTLAETMRTTISQSAAGTIPTPQVFRETIRASNRATMSVTDGDALSAFVQSLESRLDELASTGRLSTIEQYRDTYGQVATGLEAVR